MALRFGKGLGDGAGRTRLDRDALTYTTNLGITNTTAIDKLGAFVSGIKNLGYWENFVCWPLLSSQNKGSGSTVYSLGGLGTYNGSLFGSLYYNWTTTGISFNSGGATGIDIPNVASNIFAKNNEITLGFVNSNGAGLRIGSTATNGNGLELKVQATSSSNSYIRLTTSTLQQYLSGSLTSEIITGSKFMFGYLNKATTELSSCVNLTKQITSSTPGSFSGSLPFDNSTWLRINGTGDSSITTNPATNCSFCFVLVNSGKPFSNIYSLYKSTLGSTLSLP